MKRVLAVAFALALAGCASDPYYGGGYTSYSYGEPYYNYGYGTPYYYDYSYPGTIGGSITYYHFDNDGDRRHYRDRDSRGHYRDRDSRGHERDRDRDDERDRGRDRGRDDRQWRDGGANFRHGEAGNEAGH